MKEVAFVKENKSRWLRYQKQMRSLDALTPDQLVNMYSELTSDLSYARTFYKKGPVVEFLNDACLQLHSKIYQSQPRKSPDFRQYFLYTIPLAIWQSRRTLLFATLVFIVAIAIGIFSSTQDDEYLRLILGDGYVNMTLENIANDDPMAVYKDKGASSMAAFIAFNNIRVSIVAFIAGILGSFGTLMILTTNGIMVGAFINFFIQKGLGLVAISTIMIHGSLELSAIVIAGAAGMLVGNGMLFPRSYPRLTSLRMATQKAVKIIVGLVPVFLVAALLEGFVTRWYIEMGLGLRLTIIFLSFGYILWYFVLLPHRLFAHDQR